MRAPDPLLPLAFSIHSQPGVYAMLLGSGISRSSGIPTGWDIALHHIRQLAQLEGEECEPEPDKWYEQKYGTKSD